MIHINKCKDIAKNLALQSKEKLGEEKLNEFFNDLNKFIAEYGDKYMLYSTAIRLEKLESFNNWVPEIIKNKDILKIGRAHV